MSSDLVIRQVTPDITIFSRPFLRFNFLPWGGRSTAIKLENGDVWLLASTALTEETKTKLDEIGPVKYIMGADAVHHLFLGEYKAAYPDAKLIGVEPLIAKKRAEGLEFDGAYGFDPPDTQYGFEEEIKACYFSGFTGKDMAWCHIASGTLLVADLLFNLPGNEQYSKSSRSAKVPLISQLNPYSWLHKRFVWTEGKDKAAMRSDARTVAGWEFDRIIMCHGDVIETGGKKAWCSAYVKYMD